MYFVSSLKCEKCKKWLPPLPENALRFSSRVECFICKQLFTYTVKDLRPRFLPGNASDGPIYQEHLQWQRVSFSLDESSPTLKFWQFCSKNNPAESATRTVATALALL
jgi:hypothetical protein